MYSDFARHDLGYVKKADSKYMHEPKGNMTCLDFKKTMSVINEVQQVANPINLDMRAQTLNLKKTNQEKKEEYGPGIKERHRTLKGMIQCSREQSGNSKHTRVLVPADGNCFWHTVGKFFLQREPLRFKENVSMKTLHFTKDEAEVQELERLMRDGGWATNLAVRAVALTMQCTVKISLNGELWSWHPQMPTTTLRLELARGHFSLLEPCVYGGGKKGRGQKRKAEPSKGEEDVIYIGCAAEDAGNYTVMITRRSYGWRSAFAQTRWGWLCVVAPDTPLVEVRRMVARSLRVANDRLTFLRNERPQSWETIVNEDMELVWRLARGDPDQTVDRVQKGVMTAAVNLPMALTRPQQEQKRNRRRDLQAPPQQPPPCYLSPCLQSPSLPETSKCWHLEVSLLHLAAYSTPLQPPSWTLASPYSGPQRKSCHCTVLAVCTGQASCACVPKNSKEPWSPALDGRAGGCCGGGGNRW